MLQINSYDLACVRYPIVSLPVKIRQQLKLPPVVIAQGVGRLTMQKTRILIY